MIKSIKKILRKLKKKQHVIPVLHLTGIIGDAGAFKSGMTLASLEDRVEKAFSIPKIKEMAVVINSPGGSSVQTELIFNKIRKLAVEKKVKLYSFAEDIAASGGFWLLMLGDEIYCSNCSIVGNIGVITAGFGLDKAIEKLGVTRRVYTQGKNKSILDPFLPEKESDIKMIKGIQADIHQIFIENIKNRRDGKLKASDEELFNGEVWSGKQANTLGLIDGINDLNSFFKEKYGEKFEFIRIGKEKSWIKSKLGLSIFDIEHVVDSVIGKITEMHLWRY